MTAREHAEDNPFTEVVSALTQVARRADDRGKPCDFASFIASELAATATNVCGPEALLAGRPGSWEASCVASLLDGTMGDEPSEWQKFRTEPVVVPLNIAELIESGDRHPGLAGLDDVLEEIESRYESTDPDQPAHQEKIEAAVARYTEAYRVYASHFEAAVREAAEAQSIGVQVVVEFDDDPHSRWWADEVFGNPLEWDGDEMVFQLWSNAHDVVPLPNVDIQATIKSTSEGREPR